MPKFLTLFVVSLLLVSAQVNPETWTLKVVATYPHDDQSFAEGLMFHNGDLFESRGLWGVSELRKLDLTTGKVLSSTKLPPNVFAEGIAAFQDIIFQMTYKRHETYIHDLSQPGKYMVQKLPPGLPKECWGMTSHGDEIFLSDGSATIYVLDPKAGLKLKRKIEVTGEPMLPKLNELEYINGEIWANHYETDCIVRIDVETGKVIGWIGTKDLKLFHGKHHAVKVMNGIAYNEKTGRIYVTGKMWKNLYEVTLEADPAMQTLRDCPRRSVTMKDMMYTGSIVHPPKPKPSKPVNIVPDNSGLSPA